MGLSCGIIGLPNVGKSTLFNSITKAHAAVDKYPFTTIEPNIGICEVKDERLSQLARLIKHDKIIPTTLEFVDIAGLIKGSSEGNGLGNQFLSNILKVDAIAHIVRCFENEQASHVHDTIDPVRDIEIINTELILKDLEMLEKFLTTASKKAKSGDKKMQEIVDKLVIVRESLQKGTLARFSVDGIGEFLKEASLELLTSKPIFYIGNIGEADLKNESSQVAKLKEYALKNGLSLILICGRLEEELTNIDDESERKQFASELGLKESALSGLVNTAYKILNLITFFTADSNIIQAWTIPQGTRAPQAASRIHTDFEKGFIKADIIHFDDFILSGSEHIARQKGCFHTEGKDYIVKDGDIIHFKFNP